MGMRNMIFGNRDPENEDKMLWPYARSNTEDQESMMFVREGWKLVGLQTVNLYNGMGISKIELLFIDTSDKKCQAFSLTGAMIYNIT